MALSFWLGLSIVLTIISILIWEAFHASPSVHAKKYLLFGPMVEINPIRSFIRTVDTSPILQMIFHFAIGTLIVKFIGEGLIAGAANLTATCVFPIWCLMRLKYWGPKEMKEWWAAREAKIKARYSR